MFSFYHNIRNEISFIYIRYVWRHIIFTILQCFVYSGQIWPYGSILLSYTKAWHVRFPIDGFKLICVIHLLLKFLYTFPYIIHRLESMIWLSFPTLSFILWTLLHPHCLRNFKINVLSPFIIKKTSLKHTEVRSPGSDMWKIFVLKLSRDNKIIPG